MIRCQLSTLRAVAVAALLSAAFGACSDTQPTATSTLPTIGNARVEANPNNVLSAVVVANVTGATKVRVEYGADSLFGAHTPDVDVQGDSAIIPVMGLNAGTLYRMRVVATSAAAAQSTGSTLLFTTGAMPTDIPTFKITTNVAPSPGYVMFGFTGTAGPTPGFYTVIVDNSGKVMWYRKFDTPITDFQLQPNGHFTVYTSLGTALRHFYEMDRLGNVVAEYSASPGEETGAHDFRLRDNGYVLYGTKDSVIDLTPFGGNASAKVAANVIEYFKKDGGIFRWRVADHLSVDEAASDISLAAPGVDPWHCNAIDVDDASGALLVSFRNSDEIVKIDMATGDIRWRLGGKKNQFTFINDPLGGTSHQHGVRRLPNGDIIMFDNGDLHQPQFSRAVEYKLDEVAMTATLVWEYRSDPPLYAYALGFAQRLPDGHTLVCYGTASHLIEVDAANIKQWELAVDAPNFFIYRAFRISTLY